MSKRMSAGRVRRAYQFIEAHRHQYPVQVMCTVLEVAPSGYYEWAAKPAFESGQGGCAVAAFDSRIVYRQSWHLRCAAGVSGSARGWRDLQQASSRAVDAAERAACVAWLSNAPGICWQAFRTDCEFAEAPVHRYSAQSRLGHGYYLHSHMARLAVPGRRHGSLLATDRGLGDPHDDSS